MSSNTCFITGANRGIGKALVTRYLSTPGTTVVAAVRDPSHATSKSLLDLHMSPGSNLIVVQMDSGSSESISEAVKDLKSVHGIDKLDIVIANAGTGESANLADTPLPVIQNYIEVNAYGPLLIFRNTLELLSRSSDPKFCAVTSIGGSNTHLNMSLPTAAYSASKLLANHFIRWLAWEHKNIVTLAMHPGFVDTDIQRAALEKWAAVGADASAFKTISTEESATGISQVIDNAVKDMSGKFLGHDGGEIPW